MEDFRRTFVRVCKEAGVEPQESVLARLLQERRSGGGAGGGGGGEARLDLSGQSLSADTCLALGRVFQSDSVFTEVSLCDCMLSEEGERGTVTFTHTHTHACTHTHMHTHMHAHTHTHTHFFLFLYWV